MQGALSTDQTHRNTLLLQIQNSGQQLMSTGMTYKYVFLDNEVFLFCHASDKEHVNHFEEFNQEARKTSKISSPISESKLIQFFVNVSQEH